MRPSKLEGIARHRPKRGNAERRTGRHSSALNDTKRNSAHPICTQGVRGSNSLVSISRNPGKKRCPATIHLNSLSNIHSTCKSLPNSCLLSAPAAGLSRACTASISIAGQNTSCFGALGCFGHPYMQGTGRGNQDSPAGVRYPTVLPVFGHNRKGNRGTITCLRPPCKHLIEDYLIPLPRHYS